MLTVLKESLWKQFGASIDMLKNAIVLWPEEYWNTDKKFFYMAYHCLVFLDYYLTIPAVILSSPLPFTLTEFKDIPVEAMDDLVPDRVYTKKELLDYLQSNREKCHLVITGLTNENLNQTWIEKSGDREFALLELLLYNMRHVQHHAAQLNLILRQKINNAPGWVSRTNELL